MRTKKKTRKTTVKDFAERPTKKTKRSSVKELKLTTQFNSGEIEAFGELLKTHTNLVNTIAERYVNQGLDLEELKVIGKVGLIKAAHRFDETKPVHFRSYAIWWIRQSILKALNEQARIEQVPEILITNLHRISKTFTSMEMDNNIEPRYNDINDIVQFKIEELFKAKK